MILRPYQEAALDAIWNYLAERDGQPLCVLPTGTGKSLVIAELVRHIIEDYEGTRVLVLQHVRELVRQNHSELMNLWPTAPAGIYAAGLKQRDLKSRILFASIQSIHKLAYDLQDPVVSLIIIDESHLVPRSANTTYRKFLADMWQINPAMRVLGTTATDYRLDSGRLHEGDDAIFSDIAYEYNVKDAINDGYLCPPVTVRASAQIDTSSIGSRGGEFIVGAMQDVADKPETVRAIVDELCYNGASRKSWLVFGCGVKHCTDLRDAIRERGFPAECVFGETDNDERDAIVDSFKRGELRALVNYGTLTTGFNAPNTDLICVARATKSVGLWVQIIGRGLRLFSGKTDCLVLDHGGNTARLGPIDSPIIKDKRKGVEPTELPTKLCPECKTPNPISTRECVGCGFLFPAVEHKVSSQASQLDILSSSAPVPAAWVDVSNVYYKRHVGKNSGEPCIRVTYSCGLLSHSEFINPEGKGQSRYRFEAWWRRRVPGSTPPATIDDVMVCQMDIPKPAKIEIRPNGRFVNVVGVQM